MACTWAYFSAPAFTIFVGLTSFLLAIFFLSCYLTFIPTSISNHQYFIFFETIVTSIWTIFWFAAAVSLAVLTSYFRDWFNDYSTGFYYYGDYFNDGRYNPKVLAATTAFAWFTFIIVAAHAVLLVLSLFRGRPISKDPSNPASSNTTMTEGGNPMMMDTKNTEHPIQVV